MNGLVEYNLRGIACCLWLGFVGVLGIQYDGASVVICRVD